MNSALFIICVCCYILSLVTALLLMIIGKNASQHFIKRIIGIHFFSVLLLTIVVLLHLFKPLQQIKTSIVLIWFFTGVACSGIVWRSTYNYFIKSYFLLFAASFFLFVSIPSKLFSIIVYGSWQVKITIGFYCMIICF